MENNRTENSNALLLRQKDPIGELFLEICCCYSEFLFWCNQGKFKIQLDKPSRWNLYKIEHFQQASTEKLTLNSYSQFVRYALIVVYDEANVNGKAI